MKKIIGISIAALIMGMGSMGLAQDKIMMKTGEVIEGQVNEVGRSEIRYKSQVNLNGPDYVLKKSKVDNIIYTNGLEDSFQEVGSMDNFKRNAINYHILDVVYNDFKFSYEHLNKSGKLGMVIPIAIGFNTRDGGPRDYINLFYSGIGFNIYPTGQHRVTYFMGPELNVGVARDYSYNYYWEDIYSGYRKENRFAYMRFMINNGFNYYPVPNFRVSLIVGAGVRYYDLGNDDYDSGLRSTAYFSLGMGYLF